MAVEVNQEAGDSRVAGLDVMRSVAIACVVLSHLAVPLMPVGVMGVELFFVLSGFLIGAGLYRSVAATSQFQIGDVTSFWRRRWARTLPNYCLFFGVHMAWWHLLGATFGREELAYLIFMQNFAWPCGGFYEISWSLAVEEWFYLLLPMATWALVRAGCNPRRAFLGAMVAFMVFPAAWRGGIAIGGNWDVSLRKVVVPRLDAMMFGVGAAVIRFELPALWRRLGGFASSIGLGLSLILLGIMFRAFPDKPTGIIPLWLFFSLVPLGAALTLPFWERLPRFHGQIGWAAESISRISYSIYLSHIPVIFAVYGAMAPMLTTSLGKLAAKVLGLSLTLVISYLVYWKFERPLMKRFSPRRYVPCTLQHEDEAHKKKDKDVTLEQTTEAA